MEVCVWIPSFDLSYWTKQTTGRNTLEFITATNMPDPIIMMFHISALYTYHHNYVALCTNYFGMKWLIIWSITCQKIVKNIHYSLIITWLLRQILKFENRTSKYFVFLLNKLLQLCIGYQNINYVTTESWRRDIIWFWKTAYFSFVIWADSL